MSVFGSVITAMVTPMRADGAVDLDKAQEVASYLIAGGSDAVVVCGTTGESPTLTDKEKVDLFRVVKDAVGGKGKVIAGTGNYSTHHSIELSKEAAEVGADGLLLVVPYYNKPPQEGLYRHFKAIAESVDLPCMLYNIPGRTGVNMLPETLAKLAEVRNIVAMKEASQNLDQVAAMRSLVPKEFGIYSGDDSLTLPILAVGGIGVVSVAAHLVGKEIRRMVDAFHAGRVQEAEEWHRRLLPLFKALFITTNPIPVKWAMQLVGYDCGPVRLPLVPLSPELQSTVRAAWEGLGLK